MHVVQLQITVVEFSSLQLPDMELQNQLRTVRWLATSMATSKLSDL